MGEGRDGQALLRCLAGCEINAIAGAIGLSVADLFAGDDTRSQRDRQRFSARSRFSEAPRRTVREELKAGLDELRAQLRADLGYDRPIRSSDVNAVRARVCRMFAIDPLPPVPPFEWERPPHDDDPAWPTLYVRALEEELRRRWMALYPDAPPWESDPGGPGIYDHIRAEQLAREWLRGMAS